MGRHATAPGGQLVDLNPVDNVWLERRVIAYAHQGGAREAPSSTLAALRRAIDVGATGIELDVHATADGELVVCHDPTLDRTTNGSGAIAAQTIDEIRRLDNAYWFVEGEDAQAGMEEASYTLRGRAPRDGDYRVATLSEVLEAFPGVVLNLDIKKTAPEVPAYEEKLADLLRAYGRGDDVIVASFNDAATATFSEHAPEFATSAGVAATAELLRAVRSGAELPADVTRHAAVQLPPTFQEMTLVDEQLVETAHAAGLAVHVWTIDDADEMQRLVELGVDGIMTDRPSVLVQVLDENGLAWNPRRTG